MKDSRIAVLDIGTNTIILLVAEKTGGAWRTLHDEARVVRLGEGIHKNPFFLDAAMDRAYMALRDFKKNADDFACKTIHAVGTAAFRNAKNAGDFIRRVENGLGFHIDVISGEKEAELIFKAVVGDFPQIAPPILVLDIGGGSTEFIFQEQNAAFDAFSLPFGSVKLTENFLKNDPPLTQECEVLDAALDDYLKTLPQPSGVPTLIATAGTATTISALTQDLSVYDAAKVHGSLVTREALERLTHDLAKEPLGARQNRPCLEPRRADVIVAGCHIMQRVCRRFGVESFLVSDRGLRYGVLGEISESPHTIRKGFVKIISATPTANT